MYLVPLCIASSLQYLKVTIWCEPQSAALLWWGLTSRTCSAGSSWFKRARPKKRKKKKRRRSGNRNNNALHCLAWLQKGKQRAGERNVPKQLMHAWSRPCNATMEATNMVPAMPRLWKRRKQIVAAWQEGWERSKIPDLSRKTGTNLELCQGKK